MGTRAYPQCSIANKILTFYLRRMLKRSGPYNRKQLEAAAREYLSLYTDGRVPYMEVATKKIGYVVFEKCGVVWLFKEVVKG